MKKIITLIFITVSSLQAGDDFKSSGSVTFLTQDVFRGVSQSNGKATIKGRLQAVYYNVYAGIMGANRFHENPTYTSEFDLFGGVIVPLGSIGINLGYIAVQYPDANSQNYQEAYLGLVSSFSKMFEISSLISYDTTDYRISDFNIRAKFALDYVSFGYKYGSNFQTVSYNALGVMTYLANYLVGIDYKLSYKTSGAFNSSAVIGSIGMSF